MARRRHNNLAELLPLVVVDKPRLKSGRPTAADRRILDGLIWVARSGSQRAAFSCPK